MHPFIKDQLKKLSLSSTLKKSGYFVRYHHFYKNSGKTRQRRLSARQKMIEVLKILIEQMDLETFAWGSWMKRHDQTIDFYTRGVKYIMEKTGFAERTVCRILSDLEHCGYLKSTRNEAIGKDGKKIRLYSLRVLTDKLFIDLGVKKMTLDKIRHYYRKENSEKFYSSQLSTKCKNTLSKLSKIFGSTKSKRKYKEPRALSATVPVSRDTQPSNRKREYSLASHLAQKMGISPVDVLRDYKHLLA